MTKIIKGCAHLIVKAGKITNIYTHLSELPDNGVVHLKGDKIYSNEEFKKSHIYDHSELEPNKETVNISDF